MAHYFIEEQRKKKDPKEKKRYFIPKPFYWVSVLVAVAGLTQIFLNNINWGVTPEQSVALVLTGIGIFLFVLNDLVILFKNKK